MLQVAAAGGDGEAGCHSHKQSLHSSTPLQRTELSRTFLSSVSVSPSFASLSCFLQSSPSPSHSRVVHAPHTWGEAYLAFSSWILFLLIVLDQLNSLIVFS